MEAGFLLEGERYLIEKLKPSYGLQCQVFITTNTGIAGVIYATNYRVKGRQVVVVPADSAFCFNSRLRSDFFEVPLLMIQKCERGIDRQFNIIEITTKDGRFLSLGVSSNLMEQYNVFSILYSHMFPQSIRMRFSFAHHLATRENGWEVYNAQREYGRFGVSESGEGKWRLVDNSNWGICETYPAAICVPKSLTRDDVIGCARFRTKGRIPVLVWTNRRLKSALCRSSQPKVTPT